MIINNVTRNSIKNGKIIIKDKNIILMRKHLKIIYYCFFINKFTREIKEKKNFMIFITI